jgi:hypothetical protein
MPPNNMKEPIPKKVKLSLGDGLIAAPARKSNPTNPPTHAMTRRKRIIVHS